MSNFIPFLNLNITFQNSKMRLSQGMFIISCVKKRIISGVAFWKSHFRKKYQWQNNRHHYNVKDSPYILVILPQVYYPNTIPNFPLPFSRYLALVGSCSHISLQALHATGNVLHAWTYDRSEPSRELLTLFTGASYSTLLCNSFKMLQ